MRIFKEKRKHALPQQIEEVVSVCADNIMLHHVELKRFQELDKTLIGRPIYFAITENRYNILIYPRPEKDMCLRIVFLSAVNIM